MALEGVSEKTVVLLLKCNSPNQRDRSTDLNALVWKKKINPNSDGYGVGVSTVLALEISKIFHQSFEYLSGETQN